MIDATGAELRIEELHRGDADGLLAVMHCVAGPVPLRRRFGGVRGGRPVDLTVRQIERAGQSCPVLPYRHSGLVALRGSGAQALEPGRLLLGRITGTFSTAEEILAFAGAAPGEIAALAADEHPRYAWYTALLERTGPGTAGEADLLAAFLCDPDQAMGLSTVIQHLGNRIGELGSSQALGDWQATVDRVLRQSSFLHTRAVDGLRLRRHEEGEPLAAEQLPDYSDWLQRRLAESSVRPGVLAVLAEHGRTHRIRRGAGARLRALTR
ncbi:hypothetical protein ACEZCY_25310 [Streptacidiphilus sp. N1-12]|uniref:Uncharacterized protein n=2 Tax=Streptacidiphilus alkalitolerans TaxID=3342712 RepID=A0ABV6V7A1_9ACTN